MSNRLIQYGFTAGIVSKTLWSQTVLEKYGWGLSDCKNYLVEFSGALTSRPGLLAGTAVPIDPTKNFKLVPFVFAEEDANTFALLFADSKIYYAQQGAWQLEAAKAVTAVTDGANYTEFACTSHGYSVGDFVEFYGDDVPAALEGQVVVVSAVPNANTFRCTQLFKTADLDGWVDASTSAVSAYRLYSTTSPYGENDLANLYFDQARDIIDITSHDFPPYQLERNENGTWTLAEKDLSIDQAAPTNVAVKNTSAVDTNTGGTFAVTAVSRDGEESLPTYARLTNFVNYTGTAGWLIINWDAAVGADYYNVYRSIVQAKSTITIGSPVGFLTKAYIPECLDNNSMLVNFARTPPQQENPFVNQAILRCRVTAPGSGYAIGDTIAFSDGTGSGTGATANLVVDTTGEVLGVQMLLHGQDYETPHATITTSGGSGATFSFETSEASGNYPAVSATHQQRKLYGNTINDPMDFWGSQIGLFTNYSRSQIIADDDSYNYGISSKVVGELRHLVSTRSGLLAFTNIGIWSVTGTNNAAVTATDVQADPQTSIGASKLPPLVVDSDILYGEVGNKLIRILQYNHYSKQYGGMDVSLLARELLEKWYDITSWSFEARPYKVVWSTRNDGQMLSLTVSQEQEVYAWARHDTNGEIEQNITLPENAREVTYTVTKRYLNGRWLRVLEYFADRTTSTNEDHCGVDCAVPFGAATKPAASLTIVLDDPTADFVTGATATATASSAIFTLADEGKYIKYRNGKALIVTYNSATEVELEIINDFESLRIPYSRVYRALASGVWTLTELQSSYKLPLNFRPATVTVFGDGKVFDDIVPAADGTVTFPEDLSVGYIGLYFECLAVSLPFTADGTIIEDSRKDVVGVGIRYVDSKGIELGTAADDTYPIEQYFHDNLFEATQLRSGHEYVLVSSAWDENTLVYMKASGAVPTQITGIVVDLEVGDDVE